MNRSRFDRLGRWPRLGLPILGGIICLLLVVSYMASTPQPAMADPIAPPEGYPKFILSMKSVTPTLSATGGASLAYEIEIVNTGAYTAFGASLTDVIPGETTYNNDAVSSAPALSFANGALMWHGDVGFDASVDISFSVNVPANFSGTVQNTAVISHPLIAEPVAVTAETIVTDDPILVIEKTSAPQLPGANKPMTYTLTVANWGQPAVNLPITLTDLVPADTSLRAVGPDGTAGAGMVTWMRNVNLEFGESSVFTFSVDVADVTSGTVIYNDSYWVESAESDLSAGSPYTVTIIDPILSLFKRTEPDPPGSNREATYILELFNSGSLATDLVITDRVPSGVTYVSGGSEAGGIVSWTLPSLDSFESAEFTYTVYISDVADVPVINDDFAVCSGEGVCATGDVLTSVIQGPIFETTAQILPIAKKPGGGQVPITPTLTVHNVGNGNALDATVVLTFYRFSMTDLDVSAYFEDDSELPLNIGPNCVYQGSVDGKCRTFSWSGDIAVDEWITFTLASSVDIMSTIGGTEGDELLAGIIVTDTVSNGAVFTDTATGRSKITHLANVSVEKEAPSVIGAGELLTYTILARNNAFTTDLPPILTDVVPLSTTVVSISDGGQLLTGTGSFSSDVISWTLEIMGPGDTLTRSFSVRVDDDLVSGTHIVNRYYMAFGYGNVVTGAIGGPPVTTTVKEIGLIDSYKEVTPRLASPGPGNVLTYTVHIVNSSPIPLSGVSVYDWLPWASSTYQRDAVASAGTVISDIVSVEWTGNVAAFSEEVIRLTVLVDSDFQGAITNTAVISHPTLQKEVTVEAVAYVTDQPVLRISKTAAPNPVRAGNDLMYTIHLRNLGQQATGLVITDAIPADTTYVPNSASAGGSKVGDQIRWLLSSLDPDESRSFTFLVTAGAAQSITNDRYGVRSAEGVFDFGEPVTTNVVRDIRNVYLPTIIK
jgi:uncharacterized repeat protein (TIGR01451 family)